MKKTRILAATLAVFASLGLTGCGTFLTNTVVPGMYKADHPLGSKHTAVAVFLADTPMAREKTKERVSDELFASVPAGKVVMTAVDHYDAWRYNSAMYGWTEPGAVEVGDIVRLVEAGMNRNPQRVDALLTKWNDPRPSGCFMRGNLYRTTDNGKVVCEDSADAVPYRLKARLDSLQAAKELKYKTESEADVLMAATQAEAKRMGYDCTTFNRIGYAKRAGHWCKPVASAN